VLSLPRIPLIEDLTKGPVPPGSNLLVEFDPASQWYNASLTIAAGWIKSGGTSSYNAYDQPPGKVRLQLKRLGLDVEALEAEEKLRIIDEYTAQLGQKSQEKYVETSLKVADLRISYLKSTTGSRFPGTGWHLGPDVIRIADDESVILRFNDEKSFIDLWRTRLIPDAPARNSTVISSAVKGVYSEYVYRSMEASVDGIIDFKLDETVDPPQNLIRLRNMRNVSFDGRWHRLKIRENFEVTLEK
jgi:KaiC/GvpD/RAD55 family RecA-like ATPase